MNLKLHSRARLLGQPSLIFQSFEGSREVVILRTSLKDPISLLVARLVRQKGTIGVEHILQVLVNFDIARNVIFLLEFGRR
jgi:hypothetical protein